jgi:hypothetical protein
MKQGAQVRETMGMNLLMDTGKTTKFLCSLLVLWVVAIGNEVRGQQSDLPSLRLELEGKPRFALEWTKCNTDDVSDAGLRPFRRSDGKILAFANNQADNFPLIGTNLLNLRKDCSPAYISKHDGDPSAFNDQIWIAATWTDDGIHVMAIGHQEYHGEKVGRCSVKSFNQCRYGSLVHMISDDGGLTFRKTQSRPLAAPSQRQSAGQEHIVGFSQPSNIFEHDGWKYVFILSDGGGRQPSGGTCLMRSRQPMDPKSWTIFDGQDFRPSSFDPYRDDEQAAPICARIPRLNGLVWSVLNVRGSGILVALLTIIAPETNAVKLATSTSFDALHWSPLMALPDIDMQWTNRCPKSPMMHYPSLVDVTSSRRNFDDTGFYPQLFLTLIDIDHCKFTMDRRLAVLQAKLILSNDGQGP